MDWPDRSVGVGSGALKASMIALAAAGLAWACLLQASPALRSHVGPSGDDQADAADRTLSQARTATDYAAAARQARAALRLEPLSETAIRVLAFEADHRSDRARADALMDAATRLSLRDTLGQTWLVERNLARGDYAAAFSHADAVLRRDAAFENVLFPAMIGALKNERARGAMVAQLVFRPQWRPGFVRVMGSTPDAAGDLAAVMAGLARTVAPPIEGEVASIVQPMVRQGRFMEARQAWMRLSRLPDASGRPVYNGDFRLDASAPPFNWALTGGPDFAEYGQADDGADALHAHARGRTATKLAEQLLVIAPGAYRLAGQAMIDADSSGRPFSWTIRCVGDEGATVAEVRPAGGTRWASFSAEFDIPETEACRAQRLSLDSVPQLDPRSADGWYRGLRIEPSAKRAG